MKVEKGKIMRNKGITLIALVITIIVLLILAAVSIAMLTGENGILTRANETKIKQSHATVVEAISLKYNEYQIEIQTSETNEKGTKIASTVIVQVQGKEEKAIINETTNFFDYLLDQKCIDENGKIDVEKLVGQKQYLGNGTGETDIYIIVVEDNFCKLKYFPENTTEGEVLWEVEENSKSLITFTINFYDFFGTLTQETVCKAEEGMTWEEWVNSEYNNINCYIKDNYIYTGNSIGHNYTHVILYKIDANTGEPDMSNEIYSQFEIEENQNYYGMHNPAECVYPDSKILIDADGKTTLAKEIKENDDIAYYDFNENVVKIGKVSKVYVHKEATNFVKYTFEDGSYLQATDYHPIYTKEGWKSLTNRNGYEKPEKGDLVKTERGWKKVIEIEEYTGKEDCYDFEIVTENGIKIDNYFANGTLVQSSY